MADTTAAETAANFGYSLAFFNSNAELKKLLGQATAGNWTPGRFVAALQNTKWFRTSSEAFRKYQALKSTDPATFRQQIQSGSAHIITMANQMGARLTPAQASQFADTALKVGWTDEQLRLYLVQYAKTDKAGYYTFGEAAKLQRQYRELVSDYGLNVSDNYINGWVRQGLTGAQDPEAIRNYLIETASSKYVGLADRIRAGETVKQIADPYLQSYGKILETNPQNIDLDDPLIQKALMARDSKGKPTTQTLWDFENTLRKDPRWKATQNAQDQVSSVMNSILATFGKV